MTVTQQLGALGAWSLNLTDDTPRSVTDLLGFFGHIGIWRGRVDVEQTADATLLTSARYVGVLREKPTGPTTLEGSAMVYWLGDEDGKGAVLESPVVFNGATLTHCVTTLLPPAVTVGTIHDPGGTYTGTHQWQTPRDVLDTICAAFGVEYRINGDATIDVGNQAQLYGTTPNTIISARGAGQDYDLTSLGATFDTDTAVVDYTTRVVVLGQKTDAAGDSTPFVEASADAATFPYKDLHGNTVHITRTVADAGQTDASAPAAAQVQLNLYNRTRQALTIHAADYDMSSAAVVGQNAYVYDPANGFYDPDTQVDFRGELIFPEVVRISALQWSVTDGHTVAFRTQDGTWIDLTRWVAWDTGSDQVTLGDLPRTLTTGSNPVLTQAQSAPDASTPNSPTGLALTTTSVESSKGQSTAAITASWSAPTQNTDGSVIADLSHYLVQYRWQGRAPQWTTLVSPTTTIDIPGLAVGLVYDVQVAAVDTTGHVSAFTGIQSITAAPDQTAPNPPSDPVVSSYLGQLRIAWDGKDNTGAAMPPDFSIVEVHVSATSGFTPDSSPGSATLVSELSTAGVAYATAPYGATRYVKLISVDNSGNRSAPSGQVSGATTQVADGDIASLNVGKLTAGTISVDVTVSGRIATALTGARTEMNALGFQKFAADGVTKMIDFTGATNLLTGTLQTALSGRRIVSGAAGNSGKIQFIAPDGTTSILESTALSGGAEGVSLHLPVAGANPDFWNAFRIDSSGLAFIDSTNVHFGFGGSPGGGGDFRVSFATSKGDATTQPVLTDRLVITETTTTLLGDLGQRVRFDDTNFTCYDPTGAIARFNIAGTEISFRVGQAGTQQLIAFDDEPADTSSSIGMVNTGGVGGRIYARTPSGTPTRFEFTTITRSSYIPLMASAFNVSSSQAGKTDIRPLEPGALDKVKSMKVKRYRRKLGGDGELGPEEIGLTVEDAPADLVVDGESISLYSLVSLVAAGLQELAARGGNAREPA